MTFAEWWECTRDEYDADTEYIRSSELKDFWACPSIYAARYVHGTMPKKAQSREMVIGTCLHSLALEGEVTWKVATSCAAETKGGKVCGNSVTGSGAALWDHDAGIFVCGVHKRGRSIIEVPDALTPEENDRVYGMFESIQKNKLAMERLQHRFHEQACRSIDPDTGVGKKALIDCLIPDDLLLYEVKTTGEFNTESIWRKVDNNGWLFSMAHHESVVMDIVAAKGNSCPPLRWEVLVIESVPPYRIKPDWTFSPEAQTSARIEWRQTLSEFAAAVESGVYQQRDLDDTEPQWYGYRHGYQRETNL